jgi:hypothetical protein
MRGVSPSNSTSIRPLSGFSFSFHVAAPLHWHRLAMSYDEAVIRAEPAR